MKKYLQLSISLFFLAVFSFYNIQLSEAADGTANEGEYCKSLWVGQGIIGDEYTCKQGLFCNTNDETEARIKELKGNDYSITSNDGICYASPSVENCTCQKPEGQSSGSGNNGFTCGGGPVSYCAGGAACHNVKDGVANPDDIKDNNSAYQGKVAKGITCDENEQAQCTCATPNKVGSGKNGINCTIPGKEPGSGFCDDDAEACIPGGTMHEDGTEQLGEDAGDAYNNRTLAGVHCAAPQPKVTPPIPTPPPPPPPPCNVPLTPLGCPSFSTAVGLLGTKPEEFIMSLFAVLLSLSGGIALLLIIKAGYQMMTSQGNPEKINNARDQMVAAIVGLVFLIFSFVILQVIGYDILRIPGFGG